MENRRDRIQTIDAIRGLCVIMMVIHHFLFDLVAFHGAPAWLFSNPVFDILHYIFAGAFIMLSGVSSRFSRSNIKRGLKVIAAALVITAVTSFMDMPIYFGILHFLGFSMVFYGLMEKQLYRIPKKLAPVIYVSLGILSFLFIAYSGIRSKYLWILGITYQDFFSADYFPIFPWLFVFLIGTLVGDVIRSGKFPKWFYDAKIPFLPPVGRKAFIIYLLHQPVLYTITYAAAKLLDR
ncbi:MAG: DUF1624 domain-containing protein [Clostridiales bacterium]|jgi:uncharacterized membrane protein|nr:DUF1624 domain-containing protein [Clostridiales bacterium]